MRRKPIDPCAQDDQIRIAEEKLDALYAKRAGRQNGYGWRYCECGRVNVPQGCDPFTLCWTCTDRRAMAKSRAVLDAHDSGCHALVPDPICSLCHGRATETPWCEPCGSYHVVPRDADHHQELQCKGSMLLRAPSVLS